MLGSAIAVAVAILIAVGGSPSREDRESLAEPAAKPCFRAGPNAPCVRPCRQLTGGVRRPAARARGRPPCVRRPSTTARIVPLGG